MRERNPEQPIESAQFRTRLLPFEYGELLPKGDCFQSKFVAGHKKGADVGDQRACERNHQSMLVSSMESLSRITLEANLLILLANGILMTHKGGIRPKYLDGSVIVKLRLDQGDLVELVTHG